MTPSDLAPSDVSILLIDDEASIREVVGQYLEGQGFRVSLEKSGEGALLALGQKSFDIVITDLRMYGMSGLDVVRFAKERQPGTEVIVVTGFGTVSDGVEAMRAGAFDFLLKPLRVEQLDAVLARCVEWIGHKRSRAELEEVNRRLLEISRMKSKFLAITDHELRTPVAVIDGMLQHILRKGRDLPEDLRSRLEEMSKVSRRLVELVSGLHDLARSRAQGLLLCVDWMNPAEVLRGISADFAIARFNRELDLRVACEVPEDLRLRGDLRRVRQVVTELIQNAVKATPDGGRIDVRVAAGAGEGGTAERFCVEVRDTGIGVAPEEQEKIFEAFYEVGDERHHHSSKYEFQGAGLGIGLSIALEIARAHGGGIDVASRPGEGATFTFWLPLP